MQPPICTLGCIALVPECHSSMRKFASNLKHASRGGWHQSSSRKKRISGSLATNQCSKKILENVQSGAISPSTFSRTFGNTKHLVNPKKGGQDAMFKALHVPKPMRWGTGATLGEILQENSC